MSRNDTKGAPVKDYVRDFQVWLQAYGLVKDRVRGRVWDQAFDQIARSIWSQVNSQRDQVFRQAREEDNG